MNVPGTTTGEGNSHPMLLLGGTLLLMALLLAFSGDEGQDATCDSDGKTTIRDLQGRGGGVGAFIPGGPAPNGMQGGGQFSGGPSVDTVETVRDMMNRVPSNRNDPERYNPSGHYTPKPT